MKIVQINATCGKGSTGKICVAVSKLLDENRIENYVFFNEGDSDFKNGVKFGNNFYLKVQALKSRLFGNNGFNSKRITKQIIKKLKEIKPDIIHLHDLHSHSVDLSGLFKYIKDNKIKTYWTFHDCWAFTGYCAYFDLVKCNKWQEGCNNCPKKKESSWLFDKSKRLYKKKKELFFGLDLTIITPSKWLSDLVKKSFLKDYPVIVINNGINLEVFKYRKSDFRKKYGLENKFVILGVAFDWGVRKGLDVFISLAKELDESYQIVLVGTNDNIDKTLPKNIISIHRTNNQVELAEIYSMADLLVNPTREENYPTVNMESIACGTPVITFKTGGSPEILNEKTGYVVDCDDFIGLKEKIIEISKKTIDKKEISKEANVFSEQIAFKKYIEMYR